MHKLIKERYPDILTETKDGAVLVMPAKKKPSRRDYNSAWPADKPKYLAFALVYIFLNFDCWVNMFNLCYLKKIGIP